MPSRTPFTRRSSLDLVLALSIIAGTFLYLDQSVERTPFHRDEARWLHRVYYLTLWADPLGPRWQEDGYPPGEGSWDERFRMRDQPPMASYLLGLGLLVQGRDLDVNGFWNMERDEAWNVARGHAPGRADLIAARRTNVALAALTAGIMFVIGRNLSGTFGGVVSGLVQGFHPLVLDTATRAWGDAALVLFIALSALAIQAWGTRPTWRRAILVGVLLGCGAATKLSPLLLSIPLGALGGLLLIPRIRARVPRLAKRHACQLLSIPVVGLATFIATYPYLWRDPFTHLVRMFLFRLDSFESQGNAFPEARVSGLNDAMARVGGELGTAASVSGLLAPKLADVTGVSLPAWFGVNSWDLAVTIIGLLLGCHLVGRWGLMSGNALAVLFLTGQAILVIVAMGVEYARYLLPLTLTVSMAIGLTGDALRLGIGRGFGRLASRTGATGGEGSSGHRASPGAVAAGGMDARTQIGGMVTAVGPSLPRPPSPPPRRRSPASWSGQSGRPRSRGRRTLRGADRGPGRSSGR